MGTAITRQADYAARVVLDLSMQPPGAWTTTREIAERRLIPGQLVRQVIAQLVRAGLIRSRRGNEGGVSLARSPADISLLDVVQAMEGSLLLNLCVEDPQECPLSQGCPVRKVWVRAQEALEDFLRHETFDLLAQRATETQEPDYQEGP
ncbi:MAG: RrF2 family transcriptional regulator [Anaerolineae bacterium]